MKKTSLLLLYLLCIVTAHAQSTRAERLRQRYITPTADDTNRVWIMAHRGAWDEEAPESSIKAFENATLYGFEILELDVRFSSPYDIVNGMQVPNPNGTKREIILQHDKSNMRSDGDVLIPGLYKYDRPDKNFSIETRKKGFIMLDRLVPYRADGINCIDGANQQHPVLLKLDGTESIYRMIHFPHDALVATNTDLGKFYNAVHGNILLNFDKLATPRDFQETYDVMAANGLLNQCIFKAKGVTGFGAVKKLFGNKDLSQVMFTPIFTKYDFIEEKDGKVRHIYSNAEKLKIAKDSIASLLAAEQAGLIVFPGCEIVYETANLTSSNNDDYSWLPQLADYIKNTLHKRVVQFSTNLENKQGAWSGNGNFWSPLEGIQVNYWSWLFKDPGTATIRASVFVGDKPLEFRSYLNSLMNSNGTPIYNQAPIQ